MSLYKCWFCGFNFNYFKTLIQDPKGNYCPACSTFLKSDKQLEDEELLKYIPQSLRNRCISAVENVCNDFAELSAVWRELHKLPDNNIDISLCKQYLEKKLKPNMEEFLTVYNKNKSGVNEC